jgi:hypothetical protein
MTLTSATRGRLQAIAASAQTAVDALQDLQDLDLDAEALARLLVVLDRLALRLDAAAGRLGSGVDPVRRNG